nr:Ig-like domain-containing protein [Treponema sp.]
MKKLKLATSILCATTLFFTSGMMSGCSDADDNGGEVKTEEQNNPKNEDENEQQQTTSGGSYTFETPDLTHTFSLSGTELEGKTVTWTTSDEYVAIVDSKTGEITSMAGGKAKINATSGEKTLSFEVEVSEPDRAVTADPFDLKTVSGEDLYVIMCGDSIMRDYGASSTDQCGLGQVMKYFFNDKVTVDNSVSNGGRSTRFFWSEESRWPTVQKIISEQKSAGKKVVVFFSFGHNDQRSLHGSDATTPPSWTFASENQNGTVAGTHYDYMERYIVETRALGAVPVCVTPFVRSSFDSDGKVNANGLHDWSDKTAPGDSKPRGNYPEAMKNAAKKQNAILVDMTSLSAEWAAEINAAGKIKYGYIASDNTHETTLGAMRLGEMVTKNLKEQGYLASYIKDASPRLMVNTGNLAFGRLNPNISKVLSFKISSFNAESGDVTIEAPAGYALSLSEDGTFESKLTITCSENLIGEEVFVKFTPTEAQDYNGKLKVSHTSITPDFGNTNEGTFDGTVLLIALTGAGKAKVVGGEAASVLWPMIDSSKNFVEDATVTPEGTLTASKVKLVGLVKTTADKRGTFVKDSTTNVKTYDDPENAIYTSRVTIDTDGNSWPVNDAGVKIDDVYLEYSIPVVGTDFTVNKISMLCGTSGTGNVKWSVYYSTDSNFANPTPIVEIDGGSKNGEYKIVTSGNEDLALTVSDGQTLYVRIYPAVKSTKSEKGRSFFIDSVKVEGVTN